MLKNIRLHLQQDEEQQKQQEEQLAAHIARISHQNINAFQRHIPSLLTYIKQQSQNISVFCNKYGDYNLVDYGTGRTFTDCILSRKSRRICKALPNRLPISPSIRIQLRWQSLRILLRSIN
ncbi:hypothetical protein [Lacimicrobium alkaliphilum]|uniref:Uncharacterized protein n=1 Tax=Lacimicrobium alkaliphilum TaxID=1526571 RepID=A0A0U3B658_9ALTE|nr:hypothetical protein [Lacimicrobium alkaliphilum]ALS99081.1 hypothetical protein AT746_12940 [Lacimicrobium alkaliphilum]